MSGGRAALGLLDAAAAAGGGPRAKEWDVAGGESGEGEGSREGAVDAGRRGAGATMLLEVERVGKGTLLLAEDVKEEDDEGLGRGPACSSAAFAASTGEPDPYIDWGRDLPALIAAEGPEEDAVCFPRRNAAAESESIVGRRCCCCLPASEKLADEVVGDV